MKPNLFIVGSMKCGTTALYDFLTKHPRISGSKPKELHYFTTYKNKGEAWYLSHFKKDPEAQYYLEASPTYFDKAWNEEIPRSIKCFNPEAKIIIMIRDPLMRAISHYYHLRTRNKIDELQDISFTRFIRGEWPTGTNIEALEKQLSCVKKFSLYKKKIDNYVNVFGGDNVYLIENEAMMANGGQIVNELLTRLGLHSLPDALLSRKITMGAEKSPEDVEDNRQQFNETHADDYQRARLHSRATRLTTYESVI